MELKKESLQKATGGFNAAGAYIVLNDEDKIPLDSLTDIRVKMNPHRPHHHPHHHPHIVPGRGGHRIESIGIKDANGKDCLRLRSDDMGNVFGGQASRAVIFEKPTIVSLNEDACSIVFKNNNGETFEYVIALPFLETVVADKTFNNILKPAFNEFKASLRCAGNGGNFVPGQ